MWRIKELSERHLVMSYQSKTHIFYVNFSVQVQAIEDPQGLYKFLIKQL